MSRPTKGGRLCTVIPRHRYCNFVQACNYEPCGCIKLHEPLTDRSYAAGIQRPCMKWSFSRTVNPKLNYFDVSSTTLLPLSRRRDEVRLIIEAAHRKQTRNAFATSYLPYLGLRSRGDISPSGILLPIRLSYMSEIGDYDGASSLGIRHTETSAIVISPHHAGLDNHRAQHMKQNTSAMLFQVIIERTPGTPHV